MYLYGMFLFLLFAGSNFQDASVYIYTTYVFGSFMDS